MCLCEYKNHFSQPRQTLQGKKKKKKEHLNFDKFEIILWTICKVLLESCTYNGLPKHTHTHYIISQHIFVRSDRDTLSLRSYLVLVIEQQKNLSIPVMWSNKVFSLSLALSVHPPPPLSHTPSCSEISCALGVSISSHTSHKACRPRCPLQVAASDLHLHHCIRHIDHWTPASRQDRAKPTLQVCKSLLHLEEEEVEKGEK